MKRSGSIGAALGLAVALAATSLLATAAPSKVIIEDPVGDANFIGSHTEGTAGSEFPVFRQLSDGVVGPFVDTTKVGKDYKVVDK